MMSNKFIQNLQHKIDHKTKPLGSLGILEQLALQIGTIQQSLEPELTSPHILVFAADHGIANSGVSAYPTEVTYQMVINLLQGGAAVNVFAKQNDICVKTIDAGVNHSFINFDHLIDAKVGLGTKNFLYEPAMNKTQLDLCFEFAKKLVNDVKKTGCNIIGFGEMGIGNTSSASMIMHQIIKIPLENCIGRGTGLNNEQLQKKFEILSQAQNKHGFKSSPFDILQTFGGFEIAQMTAAMLESYHHNMILMIDGFIATSALLIAREINPKIIDNAIFCHQSDESGHKLMLDFLDKKSILNLGMRVGEGTGCAIAYPILKSAVNFLNEMASFESANVSNK